MRERPPRVPRGPRALIPADIAEGPDQSTRPRETEREWAARGDAWGRSQGLRPGEWRRLLPLATKLRTGELGRAAARHDDGVPVARRGER